MHIRDGLKTVDQKAGWISGEQGLLPMVIIKDMFWKEIRGCRRKARDWPLPHNAFSEEMEEAKRIYRK